MKIVNSKKAAYEASLALREKYLGNFSPLMTSYPWFNNISNGIIPGKLYSISALPGEGKTFFLNQIEEDIFNEELNPDSRENVVLVKVDLEMQKEELLVRKIQKKTNKKIKDIYFTKPTEEELEIYRDIYREEAKPWLFETTENYSPSEFNDHFREFFLAFSDKQQIIVTIDHIQLVKKDFSNSKGSVDQLLDYIVELKKEFKNVSFIVLSQLNRDIERRKEDKREQAPKKSDVFNTSILAFAADIMIVLYNPYIHGIDEYLLVMPDRYPHLKEYMVMSKKGYASFVTKGLLFYHIVKVRQKDSLEDFVDIYVDEIYDVDREIQLEMKAVTREELTKFNPSDDLPFN